MLTITPLLLALGAPVQDAPVELVWAPSAEPVQHDWVTGHQLFLNSFVRESVNDRQTPSMRWSMQVERRLSVVDAVQSHADGRPVQLQRLYKGAHLQAKMAPINDQDQATRQLDSDSDLVGKSVVWTWVPSEASYGRYYDQAEGTEAMLPLLREDLDLRALLPGKPVAVGESWDVDPMTLQDVIEPGGQLSLMPEKGSPLLKRNLSTGMGHSLHELFDGTCKGTVTVKLESVNGDLATASVTFNAVRYLADVTDIVAGNELHRETSSNMRQTGGQLVISLDGKGTLLWDLAAKRARGFELNADETMELTLLSVVEDVEITERISMLGLFRSKYVSVKPTASDEQGPPR